MCVQGLSLVVLAPTGLLSTFRYSRRGRSTCEGRARGTRSSVGDPHPEEPPPQAQAVLCGVGRIRDGVRDGCDRGTPADEAGRTKGAQVAELGGTHTRWPIRVVVHQRYECSPTASLEHLERPYPRGR